MSDLTKRFLLQQMLSFSFCGRWFDCYYSCSHQMNQSVLFMQDFVDIVPLRKNRIFWGANLAAYGIVPFSKYLHDRCRSILWLSQPRRLL